MVFFECYVFFLFNSNNNNNAPPYCCVFFDTVLVVCYVGLTFGYQYHLMYCGEMTFVKTSVSSVLFSITLLTLLSQPWWSVAKVCICFEGWVYGHLGRRPVCTTGHLGRRPVCTTGHLGRRPVCTTQSRLGKRFCNTSVLVYIWTTVFWGTIIGRL